MSSTLSFPLAKRPYLNELGEVLGTEVWLKDDRILYSEHESSRGVVIAHADGRLSLRLLAGATPYDYAIAYKLCAALCDGDVEVDGAGAVPAREIAARLADWELRDRATALAALRASVALGPVRVEGVKRTIELARPEDVDTLVDRLREPEYSPNSLAIVIRDGAVRVFMGHRVIRLLADDPAATLAAIETTLRPSTPASYHFDNGFLVDVDAKRLLGYVSEVPAWPGWTCTVNQPEELAIYLGARDLGIPMLRAPDDDPVVEAILAPLAPGLYERKAYLLDENSKLPRPKEPFRATTALTLLLLLVCLPLRLFTWPLRGRVHARQREAAIAWQRELHDKIARVAAARTNDERIDRALYLSSLGHRDEAERELTACLAIEPERALILHDRGVVRKPYYRALGQRDLDAARAKGYVPPKPTRDWRGTLGFFVGL